MNDIIIIIINEIWLEYLRNKEKYLSEIRTNSCNHGTFAGPDKLYQIVKESLILVVALLNILYKKNLWFTQIKKKEI